MARVLVSALDARAMCDTRQKPVVGAECAERTMPANWQRFVVYYLSRTLHCEAVEFLHSSAIDVFSRMLAEVSELASQLTLARLTSKVIQEMGSSSGISVFLISFSVNASSSNWSVKMAPGGVQVPTMRWCSIAEDGEVESGLRMARAGRAGSEGRIRGRDDNEDSNEDEKGALQQESIGGLERA